MLKHTPPYVLDLDQSDEVVEKLDYILGFSNQQHGVCLNNERLISSNIEHRIKKGDKECICSEADFSLPPQKELKKEINLLADSFKKQPPPPIPK